MRDLTWFVYSGWGRIALYVAIGLGLVAVSALS